MYTIRKYISVLDKILLFPKSPSFLMPISFIYLDIFSKTEKELIRQLESTLLTVTFKLFKHDHINLIHVFFSQKCCVRTFYYEREF